MRAPLKLERLEARCLLAGDILGPGTGDIQIKTNNFSSIQQAGEVLIVRGDATDNNVSFHKARKGLLVVNRASTTVSTSFENFNGDRSDLRDATIGNEAVNVKITGLQGTRGVPPAYNTRAFALGIGEPVTMEFSAPVHVRLAMREIVEVTPNVSGQAILTGTKGTAIIEATPNGANPPQSGDWDVIDSRLLQIGKITRIDVQTRDGITNLDDLEFVHEDVQETKHTGVKAILAFGMGGDDTFINASKVDSVMMGGLGDDILIGGKGKDILLGEEGNDTIVGDKRDIVDGGTGTNTVIGGRQELDRSGGSDGGSDCGSDGGSDGGDDRDQRVRSFEDRTERRSRWRRR